MNPMQYFYAGIGSRVTPPKVLEEMTRMAGRLEKLGYCLRSGGALGADRAFAKGVLDPANREIFKYDDATPAAKAMAKLHHMNWAACTEYVRGLHGRNAQIILGRKLDVPAEFVVCWTPSLNMDNGGTRLGISIAKAHNIPVFNIVDPLQLQRLEDQIQAEEAVQQLSKATL